MRWFYCSFFFLKINKCETTLKIECTKERWLWHVKSKAPWKPFNVYYTVVFETVQWVLIYEILSIAFWAAIGFTTVSVKSIRKSRNVTILKGIIFSITFIITVNIFKFSWISKWRYTSKILPYVGSKCWFMNYGWQRIDASLSELVITGERVAYSFEKI